MKRSLSHTVWECKYHIVWVPKRRRKVFLTMAVVKLGSEIWSQNELSHDVFKNFTN